VRKLHIALLLNVTVAATWLLCVVVVCGATPAREISSRYFRAANFTPAQETMVEKLLDVAEEARLAVLRNAPTPLVEPTTLFVCQTQKEFREKTHFQSESIIAAASATESRIYVNAERFSTLTPRELSATLVHEYAHIYLGKRVKGTMPRWLNEGLAMHLAGQWGFDDYISLASARLFGGLIPLREIEISFPADSRSLHIAYLESYSVVDFIAGNQERYREEGVKAFVRDLADSRSGPIILEDLWDPLIRDSLELNWKRSFGSRIKNLALALTSTTIFWTLVTLLFVTAYLRKRRRQQQILREWQTEERVYTSLPEEDVEPVDEEEEEF
jgi:hypothetical protein